jgi:peptide/nickel transport system permease protein
MIPIIIGVTLIVFTILEMTPGDPAKMMLGDGATLEQFQAFNEKFGTDKPFYYRFFNYILQLFTRFDFGTSWLTSRPVLDTLKARVPVTLIISISSVTFASLLGVSIGVISAVKQYSKLDYTARLTAMVLAAVPVFWLGMMLAILFACPQAESAVGSTTFCP